MKGKNDWMRMGQCPARRLTRAQTIFRDETLTFIIGLFQWGSIAATVESRCLGGFFQLTYVFIDHVETLSQYIAAFFCLF
jgi:hypothetical protein